MAGRWLAPDVRCAVVLSSGDWIAQCDDDDEMTDDHVEKLLDHANSNDLDFVHSRTSVVRPDGEIRQLGDASGNGITQGSVMYSMGLSWFLHSASSFRLRTPHDADLWRRMRHAGVRMGYLDEVTYRYWPAGWSQYE